MRFKGKLPLGLGLAAVLVLGLALAACGSGGSSGSSTSSGSGSESGSSTTAAGSGCDLAKAKSIVSEYEKVPTFKAPGPAFDAGKAKGMSILTIPASSSVPFNDEIDRGMQKIAEEMGVEYTEYRNQGAVSEWVSGVNSAISKHVDLLILSGSPNPLDLQPQLQKARAAGIKVLVTHALPEGGGESLRPPLQSYLPPNVDAIVEAPFKKSALLEAAYAVDQTNCEGDMLSVTSNDLLASRAISEAQGESLEELCSECGFEVLDTPITQWSTKIQTGVQTAITKNPNLKFVLPIYDAMAQYVVAGVTAAQATDRVQAATYNGTPFVLEYIKNGEVVAMDAGDNIEWNSYANMDQAFRVLTGVEPVKSENTPLRIFDAGNVAEAGEPPSAAKGYGTSYIPGYKKLWEVE
ncbi:MAG TPA: sugar ABC transporter substrate-binding protein [Solirubrobacterales bacterium]|jgi:ribose transport system substrate-binding protein